MYSQAKFTAMNPKGQAKVLADLLRQYLLQLGKDWKQAPSLYELYAGWLSAPDGLLLKGNTPHHRVLDLYTHWRHAAGLGPERDITHDAAKPLFRRKVFVHLSNRHLRHRREHDAQVLS